LLRPKLDVSRWTWLPLLSGMAVAAAIRERTGLEAKLKWPNDVLVHGKKICGILVEAVDNGGLLDGVVVGMGVNTAMTPSQLPIATATSLAILGAKCDSSEVVAHILLALDGYYRRWESGEDLRPDYVRMCETIGQEVRVVVSDDEEYVGLAEGVDEAGCLLARVDGELKVFAAGDVYHLR
ncbi:MAG: biotin--[acetyl-CoA-carboxylase] ligase, partial [Propionibacteriaceae bacterium]|nr:biotin--[acetyl-CoA-carboxylase] ligase [Propionibacteriaceae bacterium]